MKRVLVLFMALSLFYTATNSSDAKVLSSTSNYHVLYFRDYSVQVSTTYGLRDGYAQASVQASGAIYAEWDVARYRGQHVKVTSYSVNASGPYHWHGYGN